MRAVVAQLQAENVQVAGSPVVVGAPADAIVRSAEENDVDLIVIGTGGKSPWGDSVGPVAEAVIEHAPQPVLAVRPG